MQECFVHKPMISSTIAKWHQIRLTRMNMSYQSCVTFQHSFGKFSIDR
jgi:hypothetical protein